VPCHANDVLLSLIGGSLPFHDRRASQQSVSFFFAAFAAAVIKQQEQLHAVPGLRVFKGAAV